MERFLFLFGVLSASCTFAQSPCDDLTVSSVMYSPFADTVIVVEVQNSGPEDFSYPGFVLIESSGDTLAKESLFYSGIGPQSAHYLDVRPNVAAPLDNFDGILQLHVQSYDSMACEWPLYRSLCIADTCTEMVIGLQNWGGALVLGDFVWTVWDSSGTSIIESGAFTMVDSVQYWQDTICMPAGQYAYGLQALGEPSGGGPMMTVSSNQSLGQPMITQYFDWYNEPNIMEVPFFLHCMPNIPTSVSSDSRPSGPRVIYAGNTVRLNSTDPMLSVEIFNMHGQRAGSYGPRSSEFRFPEGIAQGIYSAVIRTGSTAIYRRKILLR